MTEQELKHYGVLGMKWGIHRSNRLAKKANRLKGKNDEKSKKLMAKSNKKRKKHERRTSKETVARVEKISTGKAILESMAVGTYGALKYNQARANHNMRRGEAVLSAMRHAMVDNATLHTMRFVGPRVTAHKAKKQNGGN